MIRNEIARLTKRMLSLNPTAEGLAIMHAWGEQIKALRQLLKSLSE
jgi:hypothetical protein